MGKDRRFGSPVNRAGGPRILGSGRDNWKYRFDPYSPRGVVEVDVDSAIAIGVIGKTLDLAFRQ